MASFHSSGTLFKVMDKLNKVVSGPTTPGPASLKRRYEIWSGPTEVLLGKDCTAFLTTSVEKFWIVNEVVILVGPIGKPSEVRQVFCVYTCCLRGLLFLHYQWRFFQHCFGEEGLSFALSHLFPKGLWPSSTILMVSSLGLKGFEAADSENLLSQVLWLLLACYEQHSKSARDSPSPMKWLDGLDDFSPEPVGGCH